MTVYLKFIYQGISTDMDDQLVRRTSHCFPGMFESLFFPENSMALDINYLLIIDNLIDIKKHRREPGAPLRMVRWLAVYL